MKTAVVRHSTKRPNKIDFGSDLAPKAALCADCTCRCRSSSPLSELDVLKIIRCVYVSLMTKAANGRGRLGPRNSRPQIEKHWHVLAGRTPQPTLVYSAWLSFMNTKSATSIDKSGSSSSGIYHVRSGDLEGIAVIPSASKGGVLGSLSKAEAPCHRVIMLSSAATASQWLLPQDNSLPLCSLIMETIWPGVIRPGRKGVSSARTLTTRLDWGWF